MCVIKRVADLTLESKAAVRHLWWNLTPRERDRQTRVTLGSTRDLHCSPRKAKINLKRERHKRVKDLYVPLAEEKPRGRMHSVAVDKVGVYVWKLPLTQS